MPDTRGLLMLTDGLGFETRYLDADIIDDLLLTDVQPRAVLMSRRSVLPAGALSSTAPIMGRVH